MRAVEKLINPAFEEAFSCFFELAKQKVEAAHKDVKYAFITLEYEVGNRYVRIWRVEKPRSDKPEDQKLSHRSAYCFVDITNGDVLKAASWRAPAKHARGNIYSPDFGISGVGVYGANYIRG